MIMAKIKRLSKNIISLTCECEEYVHELTFTPDGQITVDTFRTAKKRKETKEPKEAEVEEGSIEEFFFGKKRTSDNEEENA